MCACVWEFYVEALLLIVSVRGMQVETAAFSPGGHERHLDGEGAKFRGRRYLFVRLFTHSAETLNSEI